MSTTNMHQHMLFITREVEVVAEDEQQFLARQQQYLAQGLPPSQGQGGPMPPGVQKTPDRKVVGSPGVQGSPKKVSVDLCYYDGVVLCT